jgi:tetratricopeptide (TPR) repeat protein
MNSDRRATVSLCMIVRNEAHQLADCLEPIAHLFDEIVIVDTGSDDQTREVARRFTEQVHDFPWCDDFAAARNESLRHASSDWIFWLDADDRLSAENRSRLATLFSQLDGQQAVFRMNTICRTSQPNEMERVVTHSRLFPRNPGICWHRRVHEQLKPSPALCELKFVHANLQIDHLGYCDTALVQRKQQRNLRLLKMEYAVYSDDPEILLELGLAHARRGQPAEARRFFDRLLETAPQQFLDTQRVLIAFTEFAAQEGKFQRVVDLSARGMVLFPHDDYLAYLQAEGLYQMGQFAAARVVLTQLLASPVPTNVYCAGAPNNIRQRLAPLGLGEVLRVERRLEAAEAVLQKVTEAFPSDPAAWQFLGRVYLDGRQGKKLDRVIERLSACPRGEFFAATLTACWNMVEGKSAAALQIIDRLIAKSPGMPYLRLLRAECLALAPIPVEQQVRAYRDVLRVQPGQPRAVSMIRRLEHAQPKVAPASPPLANSVVAGQDVGVMTA